MTLQLSRFITENMQVILQDWEDFARSLAKSSEMNSRQLRDHAEQILRRIAREMDLTQSVEEEVSKAKGQRDTASLDADSAAQVHGSGRLEEGFSMPEMVAEYRALRASVIRRWRLQESLPDDAIDQITRFNEGIDQALTESVKRFSGDLDRARELFMGALGHDLRGPLHVILGAAANLERPETARRKHSEMIGHVRESAQHIQRMIDDLLDVAQTKLGGQLPIEPRSMDAGEVCDRVVARVRASHPERELRLETSGNVIGRWDADRLDQLLSNLVNNALQHGAANRAVTLSVRGDAQRVTLSVHNEGEPIPQEALRRIFEPLVRGESGTGGASRNGNLGLGLYIACSVVRAHHGSIDVKSSRAEGTTFTACLPK